MPLVTLSQGTVVTLHDATIRTADPDGTICTHRAVLVYWLLVAASGSFAIALAIPSLHSRLFMNGNKIAEWSGRWQTTH